MDQTAEGMLALFQSLNPVEILGEAIQAKAREAIILNQDQLYKEGEDATGKKLSKYKSPPYARKKAGMNPNLPYGQADGKLTGEMYNEMFVDVQDEKVVFDSASPHAAFMIKRDGPEIFGLQDDSKEKHAGMIEPLVVDSIRQKTGCK